MKSKRERRNCEVACQELRRKEVRWKNDRSRSPQLTTTQPTNPSVCDLYDILDRFHADIHTSIQEMTEDEDAESFDICQELISTYTRRMSMAQWIRVLGELVVGMYLNQGDNAARSQSTAFTAIPA